MNGRANQDDIQSWWEVPSIAHFCSLFRVAFNLLDFDIEELEEALLTDGTELNGSSLLQDLIVRLLSGCLGHNDISTFNYQMFLRRLFRTKCKEQGRENPFNTDMDFQFLPLRTKVEILHTLCDFRLDADDVIDVLKNLDSDSLRVHPLGYDENRSAYWYFYGTRLYKEEYPKKRKKKKDDKIKKKKKDESSEEEDEPGGGSWKVMCYTEEDWQKLADSLAGSTCKEERILHTVLSEDFLPEIPRLFEEKERLQKKRLENQPRRQSRRIEKLKHQQHEKDVKTKKDRYYDREVVNREKYLQRVKKSQQDREKRAMKRSLSRSSDDCASSETGNILPTGRQTNNSLSSATGAIIIKPPTTKQKFNTSQLFKRTREDLMTGMYKILDRVKAHDDSWPFRDPVDEAYAPRYYAVIARPMDLQTMEDKLDNGEYGSLQEFRADFQLIVDNCRQYNGSSNEYTEMAMNMQQLFEASIERYLDVEHSSDDEPPRLSHNLEEMDDLDDDSLGSSLTPLMNGPRSRSLSSISNGTISDQESHSSYSRRLPTQNETRHKRKVKRRKKTYKDDLSSMDDDSRGSVLSSPARKAKPKKEKTSRDTSLDRSKDRSETSLERIRPKINYNEQYSSQSDLYSDSTQSDDSFADKLKNKQAKKTVKKAGIIKNVEALEALELATEQTLRDINRWLDDTPKFSDFSSNSNSPLHNPFPEEMASMEGEYRRRLQIDRPMRPRDRFSNDLHRRRLFKEQMGLKRRKEIQRTIDRLQPGKSKGNLLNKDHMQDSSNAEPKPVDETNDNAPKISLGKVLETGALGFGMGESKKDSEDDCAEDKLVIEEDEPEEKPKEEEEPKEVKVPEEKKTVEPEKKEKPTPNLSAWFKAFGAPKTQPVSKKKPEETTERKKDEEEEEKKEEPARRQRKASTGSSVSERSSFSQEPIDGNSPRPSLDEPYLSPQQEVAKPYHHSPINGTIKVGFYQDTCFPRGTSEKSGSPRDLPSCSPRDPNAYQSPRDYNSPRYNQSPNDYNSPQPSPYQEAPQDYKYREEYSTPSYSGVPSYPSHLSYYDNKKTHYPVKKRGYNEIEKPESPSSFTPTREAVEQERTFTPTPGRIPGPSQPLRVPDIHPLQHHILDLEERHLPSTYYSDSFGKPVSPHIYSQPTNYSMNEQRERTSPVINYAKPSSPTTLPLNFSNCDKAEAREETIVNTPGLAYGKVTERTSPYREMIPPKVNSPFNRIPEIPRVNYPGQDLSKLYNQQEYMKYNHQIELMQNRYNYSDLNKYNYNMMPTNLSNYNRIPEIMNKPEIPPEVVYAPRNVPVNKPETKAKKKKKKDSGFQQYVAPPSEPISLKTSVPGSAFNFGPPIKEGYGYLDEIRPYYPPENKNAPHSSSYFLPPTPARASYPHPFMNSQYQQLLHRHPDELLRPMVLHHQSLIPPPAGYPPGYIMHDPINRHSWL